MLRRRSDNAFEFRYIESVLYTARPGLSDERRDLLRLRIFAQLGAQEAPPAGLADRVRERWILVPAGVGIAAAIAGAIHFTDQGWWNRDADQPLAGHAAGFVFVGTERRSDVFEGELIQAKATTWLALGSEVRLGMEGGSGLSYSRAGDGLAVAFEFGDITVATTSVEVVINHQSWSARLPGGSVARFALVQGMAQISVAEGELELAAGGRTFVVTAATSPFFIPEDTAEEPERATAGAAPPLEVASPPQPGALMESPAGEAPASGQSSTEQHAASGADREIPLAPERAAEPPDTPPLEPLGLRPGTAVAEPGTPASSPGLGFGHTDPPGVGSGAIDPGPNGPASPPSDPPPVVAPGDSGNAPGHQADAGSPGNSNAAPEPPGLGGATPPGNGAAGDIGNAGGNSNPSVPGNGNAGGNVNPGENGNGDPNGNPNNNGNGAGNGATRPPH